MSTTKTWRELYSDACDTLDGPLTVEMAFTSAIQALLRVCTSDAGNAAGHLDSASRALQAVCGARKLYYEAKQHKA